MFSVGRKFASALLVRLIQQWCIDNLARGNDVKAEMLLELLTRIYPHSRKKSVKIYALDQQDRQLWVSLTSAAGQRSAKGQ